MTVRYSFNDEIRVVLGSFSTDNQVSIAHPRMLGETHEQYVLIHEGTHRFLTLGTLFGLFQRWTFFLAGALSESEANEALYLEVSQISDRALSDSYVTNEATASYTELCLCAAFGNSPEAHFQSLPKQYLEVITHLQSCLGMPKRNSALTPYQWMGAMLLAKLAMNSSVLREFADSRRLVYDNFIKHEEQNSPDRRFVQLCEALSKKGGIDFIVEGFSQELTAVWKNVIDKPPTFSRHTNNQMFLDLRTIGGLATSEGLLLAEHAEWAMMKFLRTVSPEMQAYAGPEEMNRESNIFADGWRDLLKLYADMDVPEVEFTPPGDKRAKNADRRYAVRFRLDAELNEVTLNELRDFLSAQAKKELFTVAGFLETVYEQVAVYAISFDGFETLDSDEGMGLLAPVDTFVGTLPILQVFDFALLHLERESYAERTAWHLPIELANKYGFPNLAVGLHGAVLKSLPYYTEEYLKIVITELLNEGFELTIRHLQLVGQHLGVILIQTFNHNIEWIMRLPGSPTFLSCMGRRIEYESLKEHFESELGPNLALRWGVPTEKAYTSLVYLMIDAAYNLDQFAGHFLPGELIADLVEDVSD